MSILSVLIPSRNEMFLAQTIEDILAHKEGETDIIVVLDGAPSPCELPVHPDVHIVELKESVGQRAATNIAARLTDATYVMKLDAHCALDQGFDVKMMADMQPDWTMVPKMYNLHAFDWVCKVCGYRQYQGPTPDACKQCTGKMVREMIWQPRRGPETTAMRFDRDLHFQYWSGYKKRQKGDLVETMSILGACWMLTRDRYWELDICDEAHGSWGQQGTEVACKTWLSGGRLICTKKTWFAHMFRTQGGDFGFPYHLSGSQVERAREYSRKLWIENTWPKAIHPVSWLIERFAPVPDWDMTKVAKEPTKQLVYYTDNRLDPKIMLACQKQLQKVGLPIISVSLEPIDFGQNIVLSGMERGYLTMFEQILVGIETSTADVCFLVEHDMLYHPSHFEFVPENTDLFYYNQNRWMVDAETGRALFYYANSTSGLCACRSLLLNHYQERVRHTKRQWLDRTSEKEFGRWIRRQGFEPGTHGRAERVDDYGHATYISSAPNIDIRHGQNLSPSRWRKDQFRNQRYTMGWIEADDVPGWGKTKGRFQEILAEAMA